MEELSKYFPEGLDYDFPYDSSLFVKISIREVIKTLIEAIVLVFFVMLIFLQNIRATFIPTIVVPIALLGTCAALHALGFSINILTMFGMVLAIGILVDDAIVVIENVERIMTQEGLSPREATRKAMGQISGALVGITLVLTAVFIPMAFFSGSVGVIYRQFSLTLISSMVFSLFLALTLTPALCSSMLKHNPHGKRRGIAGAFNRGFEKMTNGYKGIVAKLIKNSFTGLIGFAAVSAGFAWFYFRLPTAFLPDEDQGNIVALIQLPPTASQERTLALISDFEEYVKSIEEVEATMIVQGFSFNGRGQNVGLSFIKLADWDLRKRPDQSAEAIAAKISQQFGMMSKDGILISMNLPAISELGTATGFEYQMQDRGGIGHEAFVKAKNIVIAKANAAGTAMTGVRLQGLEDGPMLQLNVDTQKAHIHGVDIGALYSVIQASLGSSYVNNFVQGSRVQRVIVQLDAEYRSTIDAIKKIFVRTNKGEMIPLSEIVSFEWTLGAPALTRYNGFPSFDIVGTPKPGRSTGEAMAEFEEIIASLPSEGINGVGGEWTGQSLEERTAGNQEVYLYILSLIIVFLCLAALYESWSIPLAVILIVPVGIFGSVLGTTLIGLYNDVYFKVGFLVIIGLSTKNSILIIEFAKELQEQGRSLFDATIQAVQLRLRPILMTSFAFILGVVPLARASGASSSAQNSIGVGVIGGMLAATILGVFLIPCFYVIVRKIFKSGKKPNAVPVKH